MEVPLALNSKWPDAWVHKATFPTFPTYQSKEQNILIVKSTSTCYGLENKMHEKL